MQGISGILNNAKSALLAQQMAMEVISQNVANVNTPGYTRQKAVLESVVPISFNRIKIGMGVQVDSVIQYVDKFTNRAIHQRTASLGEYEAKASSLSQLETILNETTGQGLSQAMNDFWNAWHDVSNNPGVLPERTALLEKAEALTNQFNSMSNDLSQIKQNLNTNLKTTVEEVNNVTKEIADLNEKILSSESSQTTANELRDKRNSLLEKLSTFIGNTYWENENGSITVMSSDGLLLVDSNWSWDLSFEGNNIYWNDIQSDVSKRIHGGKLGAWLDLRDETLPQYQANLDELAGTFIQEVNALHVGGYTLSGETGKDFFEDFRSGPGEIPSVTDYTGAAAYIKLSADVKNLPENIAAAGGISGDPGDNENALKILAIQTDDSLQIRKWAVEDRGGTRSNSLQTQTMDDYYRSLAGDIGILTAGNSQNQDFAQAVLDNLGRLRDSMSGVNIDEEMTELIKTQRAYEAAGKLLTAADEMLQSLLQMR